MTRLSESHRALASESRLDLLHALQGAGGPLTIAALTDAVGLHHNTVRGHLDRLIAAGFVAVEPEDRHVRGRPRMLYRAVERPAGASLDERLRAYLMQVFVDGYGRELVAPGAAEDAGETWGRQIAEEIHTGTVAEALGGATEQMAALEVHLTELGMEPELHMNPLSVHLNRCPYLDIATRRPDVVCAVHLGIVRGVLAHHDGPLVAESLEPLVGPQHCVLHLTRTTDNPVDGALAATS